MYTVYKKSFKLFLSLFSLCLVLFAVCASASLFAAPLSRTVSQDGVEVTVTFTENEVSPGRDIELVIDVFSEDGPVVSLSEDISGKLEGFSIVGKYSEKPSSDGNSVREIRHYRLMPVPGSVRYRLRPLAVTVSGESGGKWFATPSIVLPLSRLPELPHGVSADIDPVRIAPSVRAVSVAVFYVVMALSAAVLLFYIVRYIRFRRKLAAMSPKERAFWELD